MKKNTRSGKNKGYKTRDNRSGTPGKTGRKRENISYDSYTQNEIDLKTFLRQVQDEDKENSIVLLLDGITDPHNLGAVLRSCDMFGVDLVVIPSRRNAQVNETVHRVSAGAAEYVPVAVESNVRRAASILKEIGYWVYTADVSGSAPWDVNLRGRSALVMGSEDRGVKRIVKEESDGLISIPTRGHIDSLNVSVATGILLYECSSQQLR